MDPDDRKGVGEVISVPSRQSLDRGSVSTGRTEVRIVDVGGGSDLELRDEDHRALVFAIDRLKSLVTAVEARDPHGKVDFAQNPEYEEIRDLGERLHALGEQYERYGGMKVMQHAHAAISRSGVYFSADWWDGVGFWQA